MELLGGGRCELLFDAEAMPLRHAMRIPETSEPRATAAWIHGVLGGEHPMPMSIANQVACCLYGAGYTFDMNQAKQSLRSRREVCSLPERPRRGRRCRMC
jgi:anthranilate phosphoribosyltransferase